MANLDFFAAEADHHAILDFLFEKTDLRIFDSYSEFGQELREFHSFAELAACHEVGRDQSGSGDAILLQLWSPSVMSRLEIERIALNPRHCQGHTFRYAIKGGGLIQLYLGGIYERIVTRSHYGHQSEKRAQAWGVAEGVDWPALKTLSNKIQYHIRNRLAVARAFFFSPVPPTVARVPSRSVLSGAHALARFGYLLKDHARSPCRYALS